MKRKQNGTLRDYGLKDFAGAFLGVRAGTGLYLVDKIIDAATGQNPKYKTDEERRAAQLKWSQNYYLKNRHRVLDKARQRYQSKKNQKLKKELYGE